MLPTIHKKPALTLSRGVRGARVSKAGPEQQRGLCVETPHGLQHPTENEDAREFCSDQQNGIDVIENGDILALVVDEEVKAAPLPDRDLSLVAVLPRLQLHLPLHR